MEWLLTHGRSLIGPAVAAALVSSIVSIVGMMLNRRTLLDIHDKRHETDIELANKKADVDIDLAKRKFAHDREMADWKRKNDLAEQVLADFYKAAALFQSARQPFSFAGEGSSRPKQEAEQDDNSKDAIYAPLERLNKELGFLKELNARRFAFAYSFGKESDKLFQVFVVSYNTVFNSTHFLLQNSNLSNEKRQKYENDIGWGDGETDHIRGEIEESVAKMENICREVLQKAQPT